MVEWRETVKYLAIPVIFIHNKFMRPEIKKLPEDFIVRFRKLVPAHKFDSFINTFALARPTTFRINPLKGNAPQVRAGLEEHGFRLRPVSWYGDAFILLNKCLRELQETDYYRNGEIYVQSLPSMVPPLVLNPTPGSRVLDVTAAPGSKTTQMAALMNATGELIANDNNKLRFFRLKANVEMQGAVNVRLMLKYGEALGKQFPEAFDYVLLDAPCSAEGRFSVHDPQTYRFWKTRKVHEMAHKQKKLMASAVSALKAGGLLVYSTCTYAPEENEGVIDWVLKKFPDITTEPCMLRLQNLMPAVRDWEGIQFDPRVGESIRIYPTSEMEGFFIAKMRKATSPS